MYHLKAPFQVVCNNPKYCGLCNQGMKMIILGLMIFFLHSIQMIFLIITLKRCFQYFQD